MPIPLLIPIALGAAAAGGSAFLNNAPGMFKTKYDRYNQEELDRLLELQAQGQLGLTSRQEALRRQQYVDPGLNALAGQQVQLTTQGGGSALSGNDYARSLANRVALADLQSQIVNKGEQQVNAEDEAVRQAQRMEIEQRSQYDSAAKRQRQEAALSVPASALEGAASAYNFAKLTQVPPSGGTVATEPSRLASKATAALTGAEALGGDSSAYGLPSPEILNIYQSVSPDQQALLRQAFPNLLWDSALPAATRVPVGSTYRRFPEAQ